jgi:hypothetical protein
MPQALAATVSAPSSATTTGQKLARLRSNVSASLETCVTSEFLPALPHGRGILYSNQEISKKHYNRPAFMCTLIFFVAKRR